VALSTEQLPDGALQLVDVERFLDHDGAQRFCAGAPHAVLEGAEHDHRRRPVRAAQAFEDLHAAAHGQPRLQDDEIVRVASVVRPVGAGDADEQPPAVVRLEDVEPVVPQCGGDRPAAVGIPQAQ
jgi:hypothetical protein